MPRRLRPRAGAAAAALLLFVAACGQDTEDQGASPSTAESDVLTGEDHDDAVEGDGNAADLAFVSGMIVHHQGAIEMAALAEERTDREELLDLADRIITTQTAELETLEGMLDRLGGERGDPADPGDAADQVPGPDGMDDLEGAEGEAFDARFLEQMIVHHEGAIVLAEEVLTEGDDAEVAVLAEDIAAAQRAEVEQMQTWLETWDLAAR